MAHGMRIKSLLIGIIACALTLSLSAQHSGKGWFSLNAEPSPTYPETVFSILDSASEPNKIAASRGPLSAGISAQSDEITLEMQELANALGNDAIRIFNYVHEHIEYEPYFGALKGAGLTLLEGSGNDVDQACLLGALLRAAGANVQYETGILLLPDTSADVNNASQWLGVDPIITDKVLASGGIQLYQIVNKGSYRELWIPWVRVTANLAGVAYTFNTALKVYETIPGIDIKSASGLNLQNLQSAAGGNTTNNHIQGLSKSGLISELEARTSQLRNYIRNNKPNSSFDEIMGGRKIVANAYTTSQYGIISSYTSVPNSIRTSVTITGANFNSTFYFDSLQGRKLSLVFSRDTEKRAQLWLDSTKIAEETGTPSGSNIELTYSINHPYVSFGGTYQDQVYSETYKRGGSYSLVYGFSGSTEKRLIQRQRKLDEFIANGLALDSNEVVTETLNILGLNWIEQTQKIKNIDDKLTASKSIFHHRIGRVSQEDSFYVDIAGQAASTITKLVTPPYGSAVTRSSSAFLSAMEHGVVEQLQGVNSASTSKMLELSSESSETLYLANATNYYSSVKGSLIGYSASSLSAIDNFITQAESKGNTWMLVLPKTGNRQVIPGTGNWAGSGYVEYQVYTEGHAQIGMIISGGYNGAYAGTPGDVNTQTLSENYQSSPQYHNPEPATQSNPQSAEPVDMATGAYLFEKEDLSIGANEPRGLQLVRFYNSGFNNVDKSMGYGWNHSYMGSVTRRSNPKATLGDTTPVDAASSIIASLACIELMRNPTNAKDWLMTSLTANWAVNQMRENAISVNRGNKTVEFIRLSDGTFNSPRGATTVLVEDAGTYRMEERFGGKTQFNADNRISTYQDVNGNTLTWDYLPDGKLDTVTDHYGRTFSFGYNGDNRLDSVTDSTGRSVSYGYDTDGNLTSFTDPENHVWTYSVYENHRLKQLETPKGEIIAENNFDDLGRVVEQYSEGLPSHIWRFKYTGFATYEVNPQNEVTTYLFDENGRQIGQINGEGEHAQTQYDGQDHVVKTIDPKGNETHYEFDGNHNLINVTNALGEETSYRYDSYLRLWKVIDGRNNVVKLLEYYDTAVNKHFLKNSYDAYNNNTHYTYFTSGIHKGLVETVTDPANNVTRYTYDTYGNKDVVTKPDTHTVDYHYSALGNLESVLDENSRTKSYEYDDRRLLRFETDPLDNIHETHFDANGNKDYVIDRNGYRTDYTHNALNKQTSETTPNGNETSYIYNNRDLLWKIIDPLSCVTVFTYDKAGRQETITDPLGHLTTYAYDANGNRHTVTDPLGRVRTTEYDDLNRVDYTLDPLNQTVNSNYDASGNKNAVINRRTHTFTLTHDNANRLEYLITPEGKSTHTEYNSRSLPWRITEPSGQQTTINYDADGRVDDRTDALGTIDYQYESKGLLWKVVEGSQTITREYDEVDRLDRFVDASVNEIEYRYHDNGNLWKLIYPDNKEVVYTYDADNRLWKVTDWAARVTEYLYYTDGRLWQTIRPNGTTRVVNYWADGSVKRISEITSSAAIIAQFDFTYYADGRIQDEVMTPAPNVPAPVPVAMTYDMDNRMATWGGQAVSHDHDGNMTSGPLAGSIATYTFDARNRLTSAGGITYGYDAEDRRTSLTQGGQTTTFVINPNASLSQVLTKTTAGTTTRYVYGHGLIYQVDGNVGSETVKYYHYDYRGSTVAMTNSSGTVTGRAEYGIYGQVANRTGDALNTPFLFNGQYGVQTDPNGLLQMRARYYNPTIMRFVNQDPARFDGGLNWFAYADSNPASFLDPFGLGAQLASNNRSSLIMFDGIGFSNREQLSDHLARKWTGNESEEWTFQNRLQYLPQLIVAGIVAGEITNWQQMSDTQKAMTILSFGISVKGGKPGAFNNVVKSTPKTNPELFEIFGKGKNKAFKNIETGEVFKKNNSSHGGENYNTWKNENSYKSNPNRRDDSVWSETGESRGR